MTNSKHVQLKTDR